MKVSKKLWIFSVLTSIVPIVLFGLIVYFVGTSVIKKNSEEEIKDIINQLKINVNIEMKDTADLMKVLGKVVEKQGAENARQYFDAVNKNNPSMTSIYFGEESSGKMYIKPDAEFSKDYDPRKRPWYG